MLAIYGHGIIYSFYITIIILVIWHSEGPRQVWLWVDDRLNPFDPWIIKSKFYAKHISDNKKFNDDMRDRMIYFGFFGSLILPSCLLIVSLIWPVVLFSMICYYGLIYVREKRRFKKEQKGKEQNEF